MSWIYDNSVFGLQAQLMALENKILNINPGLDQALLIFKLLNLIRKYWRIGRDYTLAFRGFFGKSLGPENKTFF